MLTFSGAGIVSGKPRAKSVASATSIPKSVDTVVIGGGIVGCMTALQLAERGVSVAVCEKGVIAGEASGRAAGLIEYQNLAPIKMEMVARSIELWRSHSSRLDEDIGFTDTGMLTLFDSEAEASALSPWLEEVKGLPGEDARMLSKEEIRQLDPGLGDGWHSGLLEANAMSVEPQLAAPAIARAAASKGAKLLQQCAVRQIQREAGKISGVVTEKGPIAAQNVVVTSGVWSPFLVKSLGLELPQMMAFAEAISLEPVENGPKIPALGPMGVLRQEPDGGYMLSCATGVAPITPTVFKYLRTLMSLTEGAEQELQTAFSIGTFMHELKANRMQSPDKISRYEINRIFQPEHSGKFADKSFELLKKRLPAFRNSKIRERYAGALMTSLDNLGVISSVESIPGLYLGTGLLFGLTMSAAAGEALADLITGEQTKIDLSPYRYERFIDGSKLVFHS